MMMLLDTFNEYTSVPDTARRAIFEAAMIDRIQKGDGYKMSDLLYELCDAQARISALESHIDELEARFEKRAKKKASNG